MAHVSEPGGENTDGLCPAEFLCGSGTRGLRGRPKRGRPGTGTVPNGPAGSGRQIPWGGQTPSGQHHPLQTEQSKHGCTGLVEFPRDALRIVSSPIPPCGRCHPRPWEGPRKGLLWPLDVPQHNEDSKGSRLKTQLGKQDTDQIYSDAAEEETISLILEDKSIICREEMVPVNPCDSPDTRR
nr:uncharacterized protein LOC102089086 isoform X2 [Columba livia]